MMFDLPDEFKIARGHVQSSIMDTGDHYVVFAVDEEDWETAMAGRLAGMIVPAEVDQERLVYLLREIRGLGGVRFVITPRSSDG